MCLFVFSGEVSGCVCLCSVVKFLMCLFVFSGEVSDVFVFSVEVSDVFVCVQW